MASPAVSTPGLRGNVELTNWLAKATEMGFMVFWLLTPVSSDRDVLTLGATNCISFLGPIKTTHVLFLPRFLFGGVISTDNFFLSNSSMLFLREGIPMGDTLLDGASPEESGGCLPAEPLQ